MPHTKVPQSPTLPYAFTQEEQILFRLQENQGASASHPTLFNEDTNSFVVHVRSGAGFCLTEPDGASLCSIAFTEAKPSLQIARKPGAKFLPNTL